jgi:hypothetical protein
MQLQALIQASRTLVAVWTVPGQGDGSSITVEPGLIAGEVNRILAAHARKNKLPIQYKIGPDPSSIDSCMIGGIVANNSSGMWVPRQYSHAAAEPLGGMHWVHDGRV